MILILRMFSQIKNNNNMFLLPKIKSHKPSIKNITMIKFNKKTKAKT